MTDTQTILERLDPEVSDRLLTRRDAIKKGATVSTVVGAGLAMGSVPVALAALSRDAFAQGTPSTVTNILNFALALEIFENEFYKAVLGTSASAAQNAVFATVRAMVPAAALPALQLIQQHEAEHVAFLLANGASNGLNLTADSFDFTGNRGSGTPGPFAAAGSDLQFLLALAQGAEDTGVRAYKGQAPRLLTAAASPAVLESALRIHSVEARHASKIRRLRRANGAPTQVKWSGTVSGDGLAAAGVTNVSNPPAAVASAFAAIYAGEGNTTQAGVDVASLSGIQGGATAVSEAFDEPLSAQDVIAIVQPFFVPTLTAP
jgi:hypothetical protein